MTTHSAPWVGAHAPLTTLAMDGGRVHRIILRDGRDLTYAEYGDPLGHVVFELHGGGSSHLSGLLFHREALTHGVRVIAVDRPGSGGSTLHEGYSVADYPRDLEELADALGLERFVVMGNSNGGMMTLSVAHALPDRVLLALPCNPATPVYDDPLALDLVPMYADLAALGVEVQAAAMRQSIDTMLAGDHSGWTAPPLQQGTEATEKEIIDLYLRSTQLASPEALSREIELIFKPWGFDLDDIAPRVEFLSGETEIGTPYNKAWASRLPDAVVHEIPGGHCSQLDPAQRDRLMRTVAAAYDSFTQDHQPATASLA